MNGEPVRCRVELESVGSSTLAELNAAMDEKEVQSAFTRGGEIGNLRSPSDGVDDRVVLHGGKLTIGGGAPEPVAHLVELLRGIDAKECPAGR